jgi:hypothetical protein
MEEPRGNSACISLGVVISSSTETLNFSKKGKSEQTWLGWSKMLILIIYIASQGGMFYQSLFNIQEYVNKFTNLRMSSSNWVLFADVNRSWNQVHTRRSWVSSHKSFTVKWLSKQSKTVLSFSFVWYIIPEGLWTPIGALGQSFFLSDFAIGHRAWGVTSQFSICSNSSSAFLRVIRLIILDPLNCHFTCGIPAYLPQFS